MSFFDVFVTYIHCVFLRSRKTTPSPQKEKERDAKKGKKLNVGPGAAKREETTVSAFFGTAPIKRSQVPAKRKKREEVRARIVMTELE